MISRNHVDAPDLLVVGTSIDPHISAVLEKLPRDVRICRLDIDRYPRDIRISAAVGNGIPEILISVGDDTFNPLNASSIWFRRLGQPGLPDEVPERYRKFCCGEANQVIESVLLMAKPRYWINEFSRTRQAASKIYQYSQAVVVGLKLPETFVSNDFEVIQERWPVLGTGIAKTLSAPIVSNEQDCREFAFTRLLASEPLPLPTELASAPVQFQQAVTPDYEVRVTSIAGSHVAVRIDSISSSLKVRDWRSSYAELFYSWTDLPESVSAALTKLLARLGLEFAASDFIVDKDGEWFFLEANPHGAWLWLEDALHEDRITNMITEHIGGGLRS